MTGNELARRTSLTGVLTSPCIYDSFSPHYSGLGPPYTLPTYLLCCGSHALEIKLCGFFVCATWPVRVSLLSIISPLDMCTKSNSKTLGGIGVQKFQLYLSTL